MKSVCLVLAIVSWACCHSLAAGEADPALEAAKAAYQKSVETAEKKFADEKAKATQALVKAYQTAVKRAMSKGDLQTANTLNAEIQALEGGSGLSSPWTWTPLTTAGTFKALVVGPVPKEQGASEGDIKKAISAGTVRGLGKATTQTASRGKASLQAPQQTEMYVELRIKAEKAGMLKYAVEYVGGVGGTVKVYIDGNLGTISGNVEMAPGMHTVIVHLSVNLRDNFLSMTLDGDGLLIESPSAPDNPAK